jgi:hypothetical protein
MTTAISIVAMLAGPFGRSSTVAAGSGIRVERHQRTPGKSVES